METTKFVQGKRRFVWLWKNEKCSSIVVEFQWERLDEHKLDINKGRKSSNVFQCNTEKAIQTLNRICSNNFTCTLSGKFKEDLLCYEVKLSNYRTSFSLNWNFISELKRFVCQSSKGTSTTRTIGGSSGDDLILKHDRHGHHDDDDDDQLIDDVDLNVLKCRTTTTNATTRRRIKERSWTIKNKQESVRPLT